LQPGHARALQLLQRLKSQHPSLFQPASVEPALEPTLSLETSSAAPDATVMVPTFEPSPAAPSGDPIEIPAPIFSGPVGAPAGSPYATTGPNPQYSAATAMINPLASRLARQELPDTDLRVKRGLLWGAAIGQGWLFCSVLALAAVCSAKTGGMLILTLLAVMLICAFFGSLMGLIIALLNMDEDAAGNLGIGMGVLGWVVQLLFGGILLFGVIFLLVWIFVGRFLGQGISSKVRESILVDPE